MNAAERSRFLRSSVQGGRKIICTIRNAAPINNRAPDEAAEAENLSVTCTFESSAKSPPTHTAASAASTIANHRSTFFIPEYTPPSVDRTAPCLRAMFSDQGRPRHLPASRVAYARRRIPGNRHDFVEGFLDPEGMVLREVNDGAQRLAVIKVILQARIPRERADARLNPGVTGNHLRLGQPEVLHNAKTLCVRPVPGMPKTRAGLLVRIGKREFVPDGILLEEAERMPDADVVIRLGQQ